MSDAINNLASPQDSLLRREEVESRTGLRKSQLYALIRDQKFPAPIVLASGSRSRAWIASEVQAWIAARISAARPRDEMRTES